MSLIIIISFSIAVIITLFSFIGHIRSPFKSKEEPQYVPPIFPPVIAPLPEPEYVPVPGEIIPGVETVNGVELNPVPVVDPVPVIEICPVPTEVEPVEVELFPVSQSLSEDVLSSEISSPALNDDVLRESKIGEIPVVKKKQYYSKPKSKK